MKRPDISSWQARSSYDFVDGLSSAELAWEFLRRNRDYQVAYHEHTEVSERGGDPVVDVSARVWGLRYPCSTGRDRA